MTAKRRRLAVRSWSIINAANVKLFSPQNVAKGDEWPRYSDDYLESLLDGEIKEVKGAMRELRRWPPTDPQYKRLQAELLLELGDVVNKLRFIGDKYGLYEPGPPLRLDE